jgi:pimeloyl-ACP methyl ester carboxylesterase
MKTWLRVLLSILIVLILIVTVGPFLVPVPDNGADLIPSDLADSDSRFVKIGGLSVHYKEMGQGNPVFILLHGFGASLFSWREVMAPLSVYGRVIAYDRPAFGLTERPMPGSWQGGNPYGVPAQVEMLAGLMDVLGVDRAVLVGNSLGGTIAMNFALKYPTRVQALILVDPAVYNSGGVPRWIKPLLGTSQMNHLGPLIARRILNSGPELLQMAWHDPSKLTPGVIAGYRKPLQIANWDRALWELTKAPEGVDLPAHLGEFNLPVLVVTGDDDRIVPTADSIRLAGELPGMELVIIPAAGHVPQEEQPGKFIEAILDFLIRQSLSVEGGSPGPDLTP